MSTGEIDFNVFIARFGEMFRKSALLFPKSIGGSTTVQDLVEQVIDYNMAIPQDVVVGEGPPHIFVREAPNPVVADKTSGIAEKSSYSLGC